MAPGLRLPLCRTTHRPHIRSTDKTGPAKPRTLRKLDLKNEAIQAVIAEALRQPDPPRYQQIPIPKEIVSLANVGTNPNAGYEHSKYIPWANAYLCRLSNGLAFNFKAMPELSKKVHSPPASPPPPPALPPMSRARENQWSGGGGGGKGHDCEKDLSFCFWFCAAVGLRGLLAGSVRLTAVAGQPTAVGR